MQFHSCENKKVNMSYYTWKVEMKNQDERQKNHLSLLGNFVGFRINLNVLLVGVSMCS